MSVILTVSVDLQYQYIYSYSQDRSNPAAVPRESGVPVAVLQSKRVGVVHNKLLQKGFRLSVSGGSFSPRPPARFAMPAARGKTSLNARDW